MEHYALGLVLDLHAFLGLEVGVGAWRMAGEEQV